MSAGCDTSTLSQLPFRSCSTRSASSFLFWPTSRTKHVSNIVNVSPSLLLVQSKIFAMASPHCFYVGKYYVPGLKDNGVAGYVLDEGALQSLAKNLVGCPVTFEHHGIVEASSNLPARPSSGLVISALARASKQTKDPSKRPISVITDAYKNGRNEWCCVFPLNTQLFPRLCAMIDSGALRGLSLSHFESDTHRVPLEVSLCVNPARPGCYLDGIALPSPSAVRVYKAIDMSIAHTTQLQSTMSDTAATTPAAPAAEASPDKGIHATLASMSEEQRSLVSAALESMQKRLDASEELKSNMQQENETLKQAQAIDKALLQSQIQTFISQIGADRCKQFGLSSETCSQALQSENTNTLRRQIDRMLMCANTHMMSQMTGVAAVAAPAEPVASTPPVNDTAVEIPVAVQSGSKRKACSVEPTADDAASVLRNALAQF